MAAEAEKKIQKFNMSKLMLDNRKLLSLTGVERIVGASENKVVLVVAGDGITILGDGLHVTKLDVEEGVLELEGMVSEIKYSGNTGKTGLLKRIFK